MTDPTTTMPAAGETPTEAMAEDQAASTVLGDLGLGTGSRPPSSNAMNTSPCSSGPGPILRTIRSASSATLLRSSVTATRHSPGHCCRFWTTCNGPWTQPSSRPRTAQWSREWPWFDRNCSRSLAASA